MSKEMSLMALGVAVVVVPYLGIPGSWRTVLLILIGLAVILIGFLLRGEVLSRGAGESEHNPFIDKGGARADEHREEINPLH